MLVLLKIGAEPSAKPTSPTPCLPLANLFGLPVPARPGNGLMDTRRYAGLIHEPNRSEPWRG
jgi:hypothetical protein